MSFRLVFKKHGGKMTACRLKTSKSKTRSKPFLAPQTDLSDVFCDNNRGKVLVQYQPAKTCGEKAAWRVWFEGHELMDSHQSSWTPSADQIFGNKNGAMKGRDIECPFPSSTASPSDQGTSSIITSLTPTDQGTSSPTVLSTSYTGQGSSSAAVTTLGPSTRQGSSSILMVPSSTDQGNSFSIITTHTPSTDQGTLPSAVLPTSSIVQSTFSPTVISTSPEESLSSAVSLPTSFTGRNTPLPNQPSTTASLTPAQPSSTTSVPTTSLSTTTSLSSKGPPTKSSTATSDLTTEIPTTAITTASPTTTPETSTESSTETTSAEHTPTPTVTITPLQVLGIVCNNEADFPGHADVSPGYQKKYAQFFGDYAHPESGDMYSSTPPLDGKFQDPHGISYEYIVSWIPGCVTTVDRQSVQFPLGKDQKNVKARDILVNDFKRCNNGGVGGSTQVGCLKYAFIGAK
ncbi:hypothetical protein ANO14919_121890 [Xylariales sp. No.14919]|nr:hypothetical protein ANO14919_121890 [Xylariales sp. No.14919]